MWYTENISNKAYISGSLILIYPIPQKDCLAHLKQFFLLSRMRECMSYDFNRTTSFYGGISLLTLIFVIVVHGSEKQQSKKRDFLLW